MESILEALKKPVPADKLKAPLPTIILGLQCLTITLLLFAPEAIGEFKLANILISEIIVFVLALLPISCMGVSVTSSVLMFLFYYLNEYVTASRGRPINFLDIYCITDALKVSDQYPLIISFEIVWHFLLTVMITAVSCFLTKRVCPAELPKRYKYLFSCLAAVISAALFTVYMLTGLFDAVKLNWNEAIYIKKHGLLYGIFSEYRSMTAKAPEGYSAAAADAILEEYAVKSVPAVPASSTVPAVPEASEKKEPVNIIMIMNEAFADFSLIGEPALSADPLSGIHSLNDNIAKGRLAVNIHGSSTCNTEFEAITGLSLAFLPQNTMPFVQYQLDDPSLSEAQTLKELGYSCTPLHGYLGNEYMRDKVYGVWFENEFISAEKFTGEAVWQDGFDMFDISQNYFSIPTFGDDLEYINRFISDAECYRKIEEIMKADNAEGKRSFTFTVTIQNHGAYGVNIGYEPINFAGNNKDSVNNYLTLLSISDRAFTDFLDRLREYPERTVVIMFGDHQPNISFNSYKSRFSDGCENEYRLTADDYIVPYIAWSNYDIDWDLPEILSANFLLTAVKESCGIDLTPMDRLRLEAMEEYPVLTWKFAVDADGNFVSPEEPLSSDIIKKYNIAEHYKLFGGGP